jgi:hypothetical protein
MRDTEPGGAVVVDAAVEQLEQTVQHRAGSLEDLVQKGELCLRQFAGRDAGVRVLLETLHAHGSEQLVGRREARQQIDEVRQTSTGRVAEARGHGRDQLRLSSAGRPEQDQVALAQQRHEGGTNRVLALEEFRVELGFDPLQRNQIG